MKRNILTMACACATLILFSCKKDKTKPPVETEKVYTVSTLAGTSQGFAEGTGLTAQFNIPIGIVKDASGNVYVADRDNHRIRKITPTGIVSTFAGSGTAGYADGTGTAASFNQPYALAIDASGNIYVGDRINHMIRKITPTAVVTTLAGSGIAGSTDGTGSAASFNEPLGVAVDAGGNVFVSDYINNRIRKVTAAGVVTTLVGDEPGFTDGASSVAELNHPFGITIDGSGNLYVTEFGNHAIRKITTAGTVSTIVGMAGGGYANGAASAAKFYQPSGITVDGNKNLYVCDGNNNVVRKISNTGNVTTIAGNPELQGTADGVGANATFSFPISICNDLANNVLYIGDFMSHRIRKISIQ